MTKARLITRCVLDNPVKHHQTEHNNQLIVAHVMKIFYENH